MCKCLKCELLNDDEPIKVVDFEIPLGNDVYHFEDGYRCLGTGATALTVEELAKTKCRKEI